MRELIVQIAGEKSVLGRGSTVCGIWHYRRGEEACMGGVGGAGQSG